MADVFDALTSERPYRKAWTVKQAAGLLRDGRGRHFDPACLDAFFASWAEVMAVYATLSRRGGADSLNWRVVSVTRGEDNEFGSGF
ncbi:HD domain-containing phosphohydrolase [Propionivibrio sp.]|uniref:HD-GYP domain-containing protein n=1 Tax=Propionivibrio sp. TaxID=2212460 RepID=UPI0025E03234|nr:HD domain-containing phosphohydrolase [Propionivibrio sp.]